jgi:hypothetical protein
MQRIIKHSGQVLKRKYMKVFQLLIFAIGVIMFSGCNKEKNTSGVFKAKLVASFCAYNIVEIQDERYFDLGINWKAASGQEYKNVFAVANFCDFGKSGVKVNEVFNCRIIQKPKEENCAVCMGFMDTPPLNRNIEVVENE